MFCKKKEKERVSGREKYTHKEREKNINNHLTMERSYAEEFDPTKNPTSQKALSVPSVHPPDKG